MNRRFLICLVLVGIVALVASQFAALPEWRALLRTDYWQSMGRYSKIMRMVHARFVDADRVSFREFTDTSLDAAVASLDSYSQFMTADDFERFNMASTQQYVGIGVEVRKFAGRIVVTRVFEPGPAFDAGMMKGDFIRGVDGEDIRGEELDTVVDRIRGEPGSRVAVAVERPASGERLDLDVRRGEIALDTVIDARMETPEIAYLRVRQFTSKTDEELEAVLGDLRNRGMRSLVLDLRGNPGGQLDTAVEIAGLFLAPGSTVVSIEGRRGPAHVFETGRNAQRFTGPMVVLVDGSSASASEILAGALRDHRRAVLVGDTTFGKGSVQSVYNFSNGEGLKLTTARYLLPGGSAINGRGVDPGIRVRRDRARRVSEFLEEGHLAGMRAEQFASAFGFRPGGDEALELALGLLDPGGGERAGAAL